MNALVLPCPLTEDFSTPPLSVPASVPFPTVWRFLFRAVFSSLFAVGALVILSNATFAQGSSQSPGSLPAISGYGIGGLGSGSGTAPVKPTANLTVGPTPLSIFQLIQPDWNPLRQEVVRLMTPSATPAKPPMVGPLLRNEANVAFRYGNMDLARELYFGFLAHRSPDSKEALQSLQFSNYFRRPAWQLRWGVSLGLHGDTTVTDFAPIEADPAAATGGANGSEAPTTRPSARAMSSADALSSSGSLLGSGSLPGSGSLSGPGSLLGSGSLPGSGSLSGSGSLLGPGSMPGSTMSADSVESMRRQNPGMAMESGSGRGATTQYDKNGRLIEPSLSPAPQAQMTDPAIAARFEDLMGFVATVVDKEMRTRMASGQFGPAFAKVDPDATDQGDTVAGEYVQPSDRRMWIPNVIYLGEGSTQEMSKAAAEHGVELLLHFDVSLKEIRNSTPQNSSRVKVIDGRNGRTLITSTAMDNREVQKLEQSKRGTAESYVNEGLEKFWSILDSKLSLQPFPKLTPEIARRRVTAVLAEPTFSLLRKLAEIRYMGDQGWLTEEEVEEAYSIAAGADGMTILHGSPADAVGLIHEIAKRSLAKTP